VKRREGLSASSVSKGPEREADAPSPEPDANLERTPGEEMDQAEDAQQGLTRQRRKRTRRKR